MRGERRHKLPHPRPRIELTLGVLLGRWNTVNRMNAQHDHSEDKGVGDGLVQERIHASRRRFTRAGLSSSVVLGSLVSKPVLGAAPYHCTVSGQVSGNMSVRADAAQTCVIGSSRSTWLLPITTWPTQVTRGELPDKNCGFTGQTAPGTAFNGFARPGTAPLANAFFYSATGTGAGQACTVGVGTTANLATMLQVLNTVTVGEQFELGRATVVSLLNSYSNAPNYPVTDATIIAMFNATFSGGQYAVNTTVRWTRAQVIAYLQSLYPAV